MICFSFNKGLSGQKDGSSEKQSITNFCPMDLHDKDNITFAWQKRCYCWKWYAGRAGEYDDNKQKQFREIRMYVEVKRRKFIK